MKSRSVPTVPAGKRPNIKRPFKWKQYLAKIQLWFRTKKLHGSYFVIAAAITVLMLLGLYDYMSNFVYVVLFNDREVGVVEDAKDIEEFVADITERCGDLYGMRMEPGTKIALVKEFRPDSKPAPDAVREIIRQHITFLTQAYMIKVEGLPLVPVYSEDDLDLVVDNLKASYMRSSNGVKVLDAFVIEELALEACSVEPDQVLSAEEVVVLLTEGNRSEPLQTVLLADQLGRSLYDSRHSTGNSAPPNPLYYAFHSSETEFKPEEPQISSNGVHVKVIEEVTVTETVPFAVEYVFDDEMWVVEKEIVTPGVEGAKEIVYHITRENGAEVERVKVSETILEEPVTQVEVYGTVQVPSMGTGQFVWPVEGGGEVTPGRGFSAWHTGIDIHAHTGTDVLAADSGVVWFSGRGGSQGNYIIIYHGSYWTLYLHNNVNMVNEGAEVTQGQVIAKVGSTGRSTGPHLHFEVRLDDGSGEWLTYYQHKPIDPLLFFKP